MCNRENIDAGARWVFLKNGGAGSVVCVVWCVWCTCAVCVVPGSNTYGVATVSRIDENTGLFCRIQSLL